MNTVVVLALTALLFLDYRAEVRLHIGLMRSGLVDEAKTLLPAFRRLGKNGSPDVQEYMDLVCGRMRESTSPGHHIALVWGDLRLQAHAHGRASDEIMRAMETATAADREIIVGRDSDDQMTVYVSERVSNVLRQARARAIQRAVVLAALGAIAAVFVNLILLRLVTRPVRALAETVHRIGHGDLDARAPTSKTAELSILAAEVNAMVEILSRNERTREQEMRMAQRIQERLCRIPDHVPGMGLAHLYRPVTEVAGDYYDLLPLPDGTWLLCIADVVGHGIPAAMGAAILKTLLGAAAEVLAVPGDILDFVNRRYCQVTLPGHFATVALWRWDPRRCELDYAGAGHDPGVLRTPDGTMTQIESTGIVVGIMEESTWRTGTLPAPDGSQLLLSTDGVTETLSPDRELFGAERLIQLFRQHAEEPPDEILRQIELAADRHRGGASQADDMTMLLARFQCAGRQEA